MKISSISGSSLESSLTSDHETPSLQQMALHMVKSVLNTANRIGTAIALGESGNLDAAHEFRRKNSGQ